MPRKNVVSKIPKWLAYHFLFSMLMVSLGTLFFFAGICGFLNPGFLLRSALVLGAIWIVAFFPKLKLKKDCLKFDFDGPEKMLFALIGFVVVVEIFLGILPPTARDALIHHLAIPKLYLRQGQILNLPFAEQAYNPMLVDMLFMLPVAFSIDVLANQIHLLFAVLTASILYCFIRHISGRKSGLVAALVFLSLPVVVKSGSEAYVDLGVTYFTNLSLIILYFSLRDIPTLRWVWASGMAMGAAMASKYNGFLLNGLVVLLTIMVCYREKSDWKKALRVVAAFIGGGLFVVFPWLLRNWAWTGDPIFPFFRSTIGHMPPAFAALGEVPPLIHRFLIYRESVLEIILLPLRIFFSGQEGIPEKFDGSLTPILLVFLPFAFLVPKKIRPIVSAGMFVSIFYLLYVCFFRILRVRYLLPMVPILVAINTLGVGYIGNKIGKRVTYSLFTLLLAVNLGAVGLRLNSKEFRGYFLKGEDRETYLSNHLPEYSVQKYANAHLLPSDKILFVYLGFRGYYCDIPYTYDFHDDLRTFRRWLIGAHQGQSISDLAKAEGINYLMLHRGFFASSLEQDFDPKKYDVDVLKKFIEKNTKIIFSNGPIDLVAIL